MCQRVHIHARVSLLRLASITVACTHLECADTCICTRPGAPERARVHVCARILIFPYLPCTEQAAALIAAAAE